MKRKRDPTEQEDWLGVSVEGFAAMNAGREPAHLVKELVQNALDALGEAGGQIELSCRPGQGTDTLIITCQDSGVGMSNLADIRTVFYTSKTDSCLQRGRMGRGLKEMLCLARYAEVRSRDKALLFVIENGQRLTRQVSLEQPVAGTLVYMAMPWNADVIPDLEAYFRTLLVPAGVSFTVNGQVIAPRPAAHQGEEGNNGRSKRPSHRACLPPGRAGAEPVLRRPALAGEDRLANVNRCHGRGGAGSSIRPQIESQ